MAVVGGCCNPLHEARKLLTKIMPKKPLKITEFFAVSKNKSIALVVDRKFRKFEKRKNCRLV